MANELITLTTYRFPAKAELARAILNQEGIQTFLADDNVVTADWFLGNAVGNVKLQVASSQAEAALQILRDNPHLLDTTGSQSDSDLDEKDGKEELGKCLACEAVMPEGVDRCPACGWSYDEPADRADGE